MTESLYCFRCGDPLTIVNGEYYCARGEMGLSKFLAGLIVEAAAVATPKESSGPIEKSRFRCVRCRTFMKDNKAPETGMVCQSCSMQYTPKMTYNMIELHPHAKFLEPGQSARNSVIVTRVDNFTPERLAEQLQHAVHTSGATAWQLTEEIQRTGKAVVFTGHPQDAEIIAIGLKTAGITVEVIDS